MSSIPSAFNSMQGQVLTLAWLSLTISLLRAYFLYYKMSAFESSANPSSSPGSTAPSGIASPATHSKSNAGAIAGGVVGGILGLGLIVVLAWRFMRRRATGTYMTETREMGLIDPEPFTLASPKDVDSASCVFFLVYKFCSKVNVYVGRG
jgi:hypothetical protein